MRSLQHPAQPALLGKLQQLSLMAARQQPLQLQPSQPLRTRWGRSQSLLESGTPDLQPPMTCWRRLMVSATCSTSCSCSPAAYLQGWLTTRDACAALSLSMIAHSACPVRADTSCSAQTGTRTLM